MDIKQVLPTRFQPPRLSDILPRENLKKFLDERSPRKLICVTGKAGQGKSVFMADYCISRKKTFLWYNLDSRDRDPSFLIGNLLDQISGLWNLSLPGGEPRDTSKDLPVKSAEYISFLLSGYKESEGFIIFDNFQVLQDARKALDFFSHLLENLPRAFHLVILSRRLPEINLVRVRSEKELLELSDKDLNFSCSEVIDLFREIYHLALPEERIREVYGFFKGWITGYVYLIDKLTRENRENQEKLCTSFLQNLQIPEILDYFEKEVFEDLSKETAAALIRLSLLDSFDAQGVQAVTDFTGEELFCRLLESNLFLEQRDLQVQEYSFSPPFKRFLEMKFQRLKERDQAAVYNLIAEHYLKKGDEDKAISFYLKAGNKEKAREVFCSSAEKALEENSYISIKRQIELFPEEMIREDHLLSYYEGVATNLLQPFSARKKLFSLLEYFHVRGDYNRQATIYTLLLSNYFFYQTSIPLVQELLVSAEKFCKEHGNRIDPIKREILIALLPLAKWWLGPAKEEAFEAALRAEETSRRLHNEEAFLTARLVLARIYLEKGEFEEAEELLRKTERILIQENRDHPYMALLKFYLGDTFFYKGKINSAIEQVERGLASVSREFAFSLYLELNLILYNLYLEKTETAEALFDSFRQIEVYENLYVKYYLLYLLQMLISYRGGNLRRADYYFKRLMEEENRNLLRSDFPYSYHALAEVALYLNKQGDSRKILEGLLKEITPENHPYSCATVFSLLGYIASQEGKREEELLWFDRMEALVQEKDYTNLDLCNPGLLKDLAKVSGRECFKNFPRIQNREVLGEEDAVSRDLEIRTLGSFQVFVKGEEIPASLLSSQKRVMDLLKLLVVYRKGGLMKEKIYELFWPRYSYKSARDNLNTIIYRLRKILGDGNDFFHTDSNSIKFKEGICLTDVDAFYSQISRARQEEKAGNLEKSLEYYQKAANLYQGDFLDSDLYYDYIRDERENLRNLFREVLFKVTKLSLYLGEYFQALEWGKRVISQDPLCEPGYRLLMIASAFIGNRSEIPRIYDKLNQKLGEYYKVQADQRTQDLKNLLLSGEAPEARLWEQETIL